MQSKICAVVCAFNEEEKIADVVKKTINYVDEVVVINDGSTDKTAKKAESSGAIVITQKNKGLGGALKTGIKYSMSKGFDITILMAGDGQVDPADIPILIEPIINKEAEFVDGSRFLGDTSSMPFLRKYLNILTSSIYSICLLRKITDITCGYRAIAKEALERISIGDEYDNWSFEQYFLLDAIRTNTKIVERPIKTIYFTKVSNKFNPFIDGFGLMAPLIDYYQNKFFRLNGK